MRRLTLFLVAIVMAACGAPADQPGGNDMPNAGTVTPEHAFWSVADPGALIGMPSPVVTDMDQATCYDYGGTAVFDHTGNGEPGYVLIRNGGDCTSSGGPTDIRFETEASSFFMAYADGYLFVDSGTGPDGRQLKVIDVASGDSIYDGPYIHQVNRAEAALYFIWIPTDLIPEEPCERAAEWEASYMTVGFEEQYALDARTGTLLPLGALTCSMRQ